MCTISKVTGINKEKKICLPNKDDISVHSWERINMVAKYIMHITAEFKAYWLLAETLNHYFYVLGNKILNILCGIILQLVLVSILCSISECTYIVVAMNTHLDPELLLQKFHHLESRSLWFWLTAFIILIFHYIWGKTSIELKALIGANGVVFLDILFSNDYFLGHSVLTVPPCVVSFQPSRGKVSTNKVPPT